MGICSSAPLGFGLSLRYICFAQYSFSIQVVKVSDFGTARLRGQLTSSKSTTEVSSAEDGTDGLFKTKGVGTLLWRAPEIMCGKRYDLPVDVYRFHQWQYNLTDSSLSVTLFQLRYLYVGNIDAQPAVRELPQYL